MNAEQFLRQIITKEQSVSISYFMQTALQHPKYGYYCVSQPVGKLGDFITAPEISQIFGEMIGIWLVDYWQLANQPTDIVIIELGPGKATLIFDILQATKNIKGFHQSIKSINLIEINSQLIKIQEDKLKPYSNITINWLTDIEQVEDGFTLLVANEFFDVLAIDQYIKSIYGWCERKVTVDQQNKLIFKDYPLITIPPELNIKYYEQLPLGSIIEISKLSIDLINQIAIRIKNNQGAGLIIDYGYQYSAAMNYISSLQAIKNHQYCEVLTNIGQADLTAHVDFSRLIELASKINYTKFINQGEFLIKVGIKLRAEILSKNLSIINKYRLMMSLNRLILPNQMGELFKVLAIYNQSTNYLLGFD